MIVNPLNFGDAISIAYIDPHPPETSCTSSLLGESSDASFLKTSSSFVSRWSGGSKGGGYGEEEDEAVVE